MAADPELFLRLLDFIKTKARKIDGLLDVPAAHLHPEHAANDLVCPLLIQFVGLLKALNLHIFSDVQHLFPPVIFFPWRRISSLRRCLTISCCLRFCSSSSLFLFLFCSRMNSCTMVFATTKSRAPRRIQHSRITTNNSAPLVEGSGKTIRTTRLSER